MNTWDDAKVNWDTIGRAAGRNCRCDEIHSITITFRFGGCQDYPVLVNPELPEQYPQRDGYRMEASGPKYVYHEEPSKDSSKTVVKDLSDRFYSSASHICPLDAMQINSVRSPNGTIIPESVWKDYFELDTKGQLTMKKLDTPVGPWQIYVTANNSKIYSNPVPLFDFTVAEPFTEINIDQNIKRVEYLKPKVSFNMVHDSSGFAEEQDFIYEIPSSSQNDTKMVRFQDILYFDEEFMSFDYESQTIIFKQS